MNWRLWFCVAQCRCAGRQRQPPNKPPAAPRLPGAPTGGIHSVKKEYTTLKRVPSKRHCLVPPGCRLEKPCRDTPVGIPLGKNTLGDDDASHQAAISHAISRRKELVISNEIRRLPSNTQTVACARRPLRRAGACQPLLVYVLAHWQ